MEILESQTTSFFIASAAGEEAQDDIGGSGPAWNPPGILFPSTLQNQGTSLITSLLLMRCRIMAKEARWAVQDAKARFSEFLEASLNEGPQIVTRRGVEAAVLVPFEEWQRLQGVARPTLKELLLAKDPRAEIPVPPRSRWRRRPPAMPE